MCHATARPSAQPIEEPTRPEPMPASRPAATSATSATPTPTPTPTAPAATTAERAHNRANALKAKKQKAKQQAAAAAAKTESAAAAASTTTTAGAALSALGTFYRTVFYFLWSGGSFSECPHLVDDVQARCHIYSMTLILYLWNLPHYRNGNFQEDMVKNLRNVAIPGTGIPLSVFCYFRVTVYFMMLVAYPLVCLAAALKAADFKDWDAVPGHFVEQLLHPQDWFSYWRLNCRLASLHAHTTKDGGYEYEDKWAFLTVGEERGVSVSPWLKVQKLFVKHRNEEGGLGCASYANAAQGGDWIIQECLANGAEIAHLLPEDAPLSTFRVMTCSDGGLSTVAAGCENVKSLSCVFRAGRAGAMTDHSSILFDVDTATGTLKKGTTNAHWYELGLGKIATTPWTSTHDETHHPDSGAPITGQKLPNIARILKTAEDAHRKLSPGVPIIGWDVAVTDKGMFLLEGNFSSNFFRGSFNKANYFSFVEQYFIDLEQRAACANGATVETPAVPIKPKYTAAAEQRTAAPPTPSLETEDAMMQKRFAHTRIRSDTM